MNTEHFKYILTIAQYQSISKAADKLCLERTYLSKIVRNIEQELNVTLFIRNSKGVLATEEGTHVLLEFQRILGSLESIKHSVAVSQIQVYPEYTDKFTILNPRKIRPREYKQDYLLNIQKKFPNMKISVIEEDVKKMLSLVENEPNAIALTLRCNKWEDLNQPIPEHLIYRPFQSTPLVALASPNNPIAKKYQTISLATLAKQELLLQDFLWTEQGYIYQLLKPYIAKEPHIFVNSHAMFMKLLESAPYFSIGLYSDTVSDHLLQIPIREKIFIDTGILYHKNLLNNLPGKYVLEALLSTYERIYNNQK